MRVFAVGLIAALGCARPKPPPAPEKLWRPPPTNDLEDCGLGRRKLASAEHLREQCAAGSVEACVTVTALGPLTSERDKLFARSQLLTHCEKHPSCGCYAYGVALVEDERERFAAEGIDMLRLSCSRGAGDACQKIDLFIDRCNDNDTKRVCQVLFDEHKLHRRDKAPARGPAQLPERLRGCFVIARDERGGADPPEAAAGSIYCLEADRVSFKAPGGDWESLLTLWLADLDHPTTFETAQGLIFDVASEPIRLKGLGRAATLAPERSVAPLSVPRIERVCGRARRCAALVMPAPGTRTIELGGPPSSAPATSAGLSGCRELEAWARLQNPDLPPECG